MSSYHYAVNDETGEIVFLVGKNSPVTREVADRLLAKVGLSWPECRVLSDGLDAEADELETLEATGYVAIAPLGGVDNLREDVAAALRAVRLLQEIG